MFSSCRVVGGETRQPLPAKAILWIGPLLTPAHLVLHAQFVAFNLICTPGKTNASLYYHADNHSQIRAPDGASSWQSWTFDPFYPANILLGQRVVTSNLRAMASNLPAMASNLLVMASNLRVMASNLRAIASNLLIIFTPPTFSWVKEPSKP